MNLNTNVTLSGSPICDIKNTKETKFYELLSAKMSGNSSLRLFYRFRGLKFFIVKITKLNASRLFSAGIKIFSSQNKCKTKPMLLEIETQMACIGFNS